MNMAGRTLITIAAIASYDNDIHISSDDGHTTTTRAIITQHKKSSIRVKVNESDGSEPT